MKDKTEYYMRQFKGDDRLKSGMYIALWRLDLESNKLSYREVAGGSVSTTWSDSGYYSIAQLKNRFDDLREITVEELPLIL